MEYFVNFNKFNNNQFHIFRLKIPRQDHPNMYKCIKIEYETIDHILRAAKERFFTFITIRNSHNMSKLILRFFSL